MELKEEIEQNIKSKMIGMQCGIFFDFQAQDIVVASKNEVSAVKVIK